MPHLRWMIAIVLLTACSSQSDRAQRSESGQHTFQVTETDGVQTAVTSGGPRFTDELFTYEKVMMIDTEQHEDAILYQPVQFMADDAGNMYIFDQGIGSILVYDVTGRYTHSIGRKGFGPGESSYGQIQQIHDGIIQFYGLKERRTSRFSIDGALRDVTTVPTDIGIASAAGMIVLPDGNLLILTDVKPVAAGVKGPVRNPGFQRSGILILSPDGDSLGVVETPIVKVAEMIPIDLGFKAYFAPAPLGFGPSPMALFHPVHGIVLSTGTLPELEIHTPGGRRVRSIRIELDPEPVTARDRNRILQTMRETAGQLTDQYQATAMLTMAEQYPFVDEKAFWGTVAIDAEGYFWLDLSLPPETMDGDVHTFMVLSPEGEYLGNTSRPFGPGGSISGGRLYILEENAETGEMLPAVYSIVPAVSGFVYPINN